jgi:hypothetical protein
MNALRRVQVVWKIGIAGHKYCYCTVPYIMARSVSGINQSALSMLHYCAVGEVDFGIFLDFQFPTVCS